MRDYYTSEQLSQELPRPLLNFLWYLWDTYSNPSEPEFRVTLKDGGEANVQRFLVQSAGIDVTQDFGCSINAEIAVRKCGTRYLMEYV